MNEYLVIKNESQDKWIGIDRTSGGYPYDTELLNAHRFNSKKEAASYRDVINPKDEWQLYIMTVSSEPVNWSNIDELYKQRDDAQKKIDKIENQISEMHKVKK